MVVRFIPSSAAEPASQQTDRGDLAEVVDLRSRLAGTVGSGRRAPNRPTESGVAPVEELAPVAQLHAQPRPTSKPEQCKSKAGQLRPEHEQPEHEQPEHERPESEQLEPGSEPEPEPNSEPVRTASEDAVRLLARRARSSGELRRELASLGHDANEVEEVLLECESSLYLDDLGLARVLTESLRARKRASRAQIRVKLRERLLPDGVIEEALGELDDDEENELLRQAAADRARKMTGLDRQTAERRLLGFLARRGWSGERAVRVAREALDSTAARGTVRFR